jgi:hypothetical protein
MRFERCQCDALDGLVEIFQNPLRSLKTVIPAPAAPSFPTLPTMNDSHCQFCSRPKLFVRTMLGDFVQSGSCPWCPSAGGFRSAGAPPLHNSLSLDSGHFSNIGAFTVSQPNITVQGPMIFLQQDDFELSSFLDSSQQFSQPTGSANTYPDIFNPKSKAPASFASSPPPPSNTSAQDDDFLVDIQEAGVERCGDCYRRAVCERVFDGYRCNDCAEAAKLASSPSSRAASSSLLPSISLPPSLPIAALPIVARNEGNGSADAGDDADDGDGARADDDVLGVIDLDEIRQSDSDYQHVTDTNMIANDAYFNLNMRQTAAQKREQLVSNLVRAAEILRGKNFQKAWDIYEHVLDSKFMGQVGRKSASPLPAPARASKHDINNAIADRIWRQENNRNPKSAPFGYIELLKAYDNARASKSAAKAARKGAQSVDRIQSLPSSATAAPRSVPQPRHVDFDPDLDVDDKLPVTEVSVPAALTNSALPMVDEADEGEEEDVDDMRKDADVMYVSLTIDDQLVVLDDEHNVQEGNRADSAADAHITLEQAVDFWREHSAVQSRTSSDTQQRESAELVDKIHAERCAASRMRRHEKRANLPDDHFCPHCKKYYGLRPAHEQTQHANKCARTLQK